MQKVKVTRQWKHYKVGSIQQFKPAETKALKALGYVEDYQEEPERVVIEKSKPAQQSKQTKKRSYKRKDLKAED